MEINRKEGVYVEWLRLIGVKQNLHVCGLPQPRLIRAHSSCSRVSGELRSPGKPQKKVKNCTQLRIQQISRNSSNFPT